MHIYKDIISGDELFSSEFKTELLFECLYKVEARLIKKKLGFDESSCGFNASADGADGEEGAEDGVKHIVDLIDNHKLEETQFNTKKEYQTYIKGYMKRLKEKLEADSPDDVAPFTKNVTEAVKHILGKFKDLCFYVGCSMDYDAMIPVMENEGEKYMFYFFKHGVIEEKV